jgi:hypothetical protein
MASDSHGDAMWFRRRKTVVSEKIISCIWATHQDGIYVRCGENQVYNSAPQIQQLGNIVV